MSVIKVIQDGAVKAVVKASLGSIVINNNYGEGVAVPDTLSFTAGENLSSGRAVIKEAGKVYYYDPSNLNHAGRGIGVTTTSGIANSSVTVQISGIIQDGAFSFSVDRPVYVGANGLLTTTLTSMAIVQKAGVSLSVTSMIIEFDLPLLRTL